MIRRFTADLKKYRNYISYSGIADLKAEVAGSYLSSLWWVIEPFCFMLIYTAVFGIVFGAKEQYFPAFVFIGITMWNFFNHMCTYSVKAVKTNKRIISKTYMPKFVLILSKMFSNGVKMLISFAIVIIMVIVYRISPTPIMFMCIPVLLIMMLFTFGICELLLHFGVYITDLHKAIGIILKMVFYLTGVFYDIEKRIGSAFGERAAMLLSKLNPMAFSLTSIREALLYGEMPDLTWMLIWLAGGLILSVIGTVLIYKNENSYIKVI